MVGFTVCIILAFVHNIYSGAVFILQSCHLVMIPGRVVMANFSLSKIFYGNVGAKLNTHDLFCRKFAPVCQKIVPFCPTYFCNQRHRRFLVSADGYATGSVSFSFFLSASLDHTKSYEWLLMKLSGPTTDFSGNSFQIQCSTSR